jgi:predicted O-methyltransferase YrrM
MGYREVVAAVGTTPFMTPEQGRRIYAHVLRTRPHDVLELGTCHGTSTAYIAAALAERGEGKVTTVDHVTWNGSPRPEELLDRLKLRDFVDIVRVEDSSYLWFLKQQIERQSDSDGNCEPLYDFVYLDGAHNWTIDGFASLLAAKLLRPKGWMLLDDLDFDFAHVAGETANATAFQLSAGERSETHMRKVFDLLLRQHPDFDEFVVEDDDWGWAHKGSGPRNYTLITNRSLRAMVVSGLRRLGRRYLG